MSMNLARFHGEKEKKIHLYSCLVASKADCMESGVSGKRVGHMGGSGFCG